MFGPPVMLTLSQFVKIISALIHTNTICHHFISHDSKNIIQLPFEVTCAFKKLEKRFYDPTWCNMLTPPSEYFYEFLLHLVTFARSNWHSPNAESNHAEFLLGFLLHTNMVIAFDEENSKHIKDLVFTQFPADEARYLLWGTPPFRRLILPAEGYDFLSDAWQAAQQYPTIAQLNAVLLKKDDDDRKAALILQQEREKQQQQELEAQKQLQYFKILDCHYFLFPLSLADFSLVLEALYKTGRVQFPHPSPFVQKQTIIPYFLSLQIVQFAYLARQNHHRKEKTQGFLELMQNIIRSAKNAPEYREGCLFLLGFLLYHNIHVYDGERLYRIAELYYAEASPLEKQYLQSGGDLLPVSNAEWQKQQCYPGRDILEFALNSTSFTFLPSFEMTKAEDLPVQSEVAFKNAFLHEPARFI